MGEYKGFTKFMLPEDQEREVHYILYRLRLMEGDEAPRSKSALLRRLIQKRAEELHKLEDAERESA